MKINVLRNAIGMAAFAALLALVWLGLAHIRRAGLDNALVTAVYHGKTAESELLLAQGADANAQLSMRYFIPTSLRRAKWEFDYYRTEGNRGLPVLMIAEMRGDREIMHALLLHGADADAHGSLDTTPLMDSAFHGNILIARDLIAHGADVNAQDTRHETVLANMAGGMEMWMSGATHTPRQHYLWGQADYANMLQLLLDHGANINDRDFQGRTALIEAAAGSDVPIVKLLLRRGANVHLVGTDSLTALAAAKRAAKTNGRAEVIVKLLQKAGAKK